MPVMRAFFIAKSYFVIVWPVWAKWVQWVAAGRFPSVSAVLQVLLQLCAKGPFSLAINCGPDWLSNPDE